jgi:ATPase subunit of ABC transporter with duplicated ATPase domains
MPAIHFSHVSFSYSSAVPIIEDASFDIGPGWTGLVGVNGIGKTTLMSLIAGLRTPDTGRVVVEPAGLSPVLCEQRVDDLSDAITTLAVSWDRRAVRMRSSLHLEAADLDRWPDLSPGERKRWQIGAALAAEPDVLLLDEPTNHLDGEARSMLVGALASFRGCGVVISHDRTLLDELTERTIWIEGGRVEIWGGPYDVAREARAAAAAQRASTYERLRSQQRKLERRLDEKRRASVQKDAERLRERRAAGKHDLDTRGAAATYKHERGQKTGAQTVSSMTRSLDRIGDELAASAMTKEKGGSISFAADTAPKEHLIRHAGPVMAGERRLFDVDLGVRRTDRIRIAGPNGAGKTTLVETLLAGLTIPRERVLYLAQETSPTDAMAWLDQVRSLDPDQRGTVMALVARLGSDPGPLLVTDLPSPGEARKVALALGLGTATWLLVLDEPTNHLDLPSIERLEEALATHAGALILITHDDALAAAVTDTTWIVGDDGVTVGPDPGGVRLSDPGSVDIS